MGKLTPSWRYVLRHLTSDKGWTPLRELPDGNGRAGCASGMKVRAMKQAGVIEYGSATGFGPYGYRITDAGRRALAEHEGGG